MIPKRSILSMILLVFFVVPLAACSSDRQTADNKGKASQGTSTINGQKKAGDQQMSQPAVDKKIVMENRAETAIAAPTKPAPRQALADLAPAQPPIPAPVQAAKAAAPPKSKEVRSQAPRLMPQAIPGAAAYLPSVNRGRQWPGILQSPERKWFYADANHASLHFFG